MPRTSLHLSGTGHNRCELCPEWHKLKKELGCCPCRTEALITFHGIESEALLILLDQEGICASSGSACLADSDEPSHVVKAMKPESTASRQMTRFSLDSANTAAEAKAALNGLDRAVKMLRG
jgi:cysteine sulfinate desulfinase/cysteine desulfurase-like protein